MITVYYVNSCVIHVIWSLRSHKKEPIFCLKIVISMCEILSRKDRKAHLILLFQTENVTITSKNTLKKRSLRRFVFFSFHFANNLLIYINFKPCCFCKIVTNDVFQLPLDCASFSVGNRNLYFWPNCYKSPMVRAADSWSIEALLVYNANCNPL